LAHLGEYGARGQNEGDVNEGVERIVHCTKENNSDKVTTEIMMVVFEVLSRSLSVEIVIITIAVRTLTAEWESLHYYC